jgi:hypothetical protein
MSLSFEHYKATFINNILLARSQEEVKSLVDEEMKILEQKKISIQSKANLIQQTICELELFSPMQKDAQQWSNISIAKILFYRIKHKLQDTVPVR